MDRILLKAAIAITAALALTACSDSTTNATDAKTTPEPKKEAVAPAEPVPGKTAFYAMYKPAREWSADLLPLTLASEDVPEMRGSGGKFAVWTAVFVSPSKRQARTFYYSAVEHGSMHKGVTAGGAQGWSGATQKSKPFQVTEFSIDSDQAFETANQKAAAWAKKHPNVNPVFFLASESRFPSPVWYIIWGSKTNGYAAFVNATTGKEVTVK